MPGEAPEEEEAPPVPCVALPDSEVPPRQQLFEAVFQGCSSNKAKLESLKDRQAKVEAQEMDEAKMKAMSYSELGVKDLHDVLNTIKTQHGPLFPNKGVFLDMGSGAGKACVAAGLLHPFEKVVGIEAVGCLNDMADAAKAKLNEVELPEGLDGFTKPQLEFIRGDFAADFSQLEAIAPSVVVAVAVATTFVEEQLQAMKKLAEKMPDSSIFITYTQSLPESVLDQRNWFPKQRRAVLVKKRLAKRGVDPDTVVIPELPVEEPVGWVQISKDTVETEWGPTTRFLFKREPATKPAADGAPAAEGEGQS